MHAQVVDVVVVVALRVLAVSQVKTPSLAIVSVAAAEIRACRGELGLCSLCSKRATCEACAHVSDHCRKLHSASPAGTQCSMSRAASAAFYRVESGAVYHSLRPVLGDVLRRLRPRADLCSQVRIDAPAWRM